VLSIKGLAERPIEASFHAPVFFSLSPFSFSIPPEGKIEGEASAEINLAILPPMLNLEDQIAQGILNLTASVGGELKAPKIHYPKKRSDCLPTFIKKNLKISSKKQKFP